MRSARENWKKKRRRGPGGDGAGARQLGRAVLCGICARPLSRHGLTQRYKLSNAIDEKPASASSARCSLLTTDSGLESAS